MEQNYLESMLDYSDTMIEIDKLNEQAKKAGKSSFIIDRAKYIDGRIYAISKFFNFIEANMGIYNAKMINMTNIFGDQRQSISVPVYKDPKIEIVER